MAYQFKEKYLEELKRELRNNKISQNEINDIISDYSQMYDDALESGLSPEDIYNKFGDPKEIADDLKSSSFEDYIPFKSGDGSNLNKKIRDLLSVLVVVAYLIMGMVFNLWHPGWIIFFLIPLFSILLSRKKTLSLIMTETSPIVAITVYSILGHFFNLWHPGWLVFFYIPVISIIFLSRLKWCVISFKGPFETKRYFKTRKEAMDHLLSIQDKVDSVKIIYKD